MDEFKTLCNKKYQVIRILEYSKNSNFGDIYLIKNEQNLNLTVKKIATSKEDLNRIKDLEILKLSNNENVLRYVENFHENNQDYLVFEYLLDGILEDSIIHYKKNEKIFKEEQVFEWTIQLMNGLAALHAKNIVHGDICPGNIYCSFNKLKLGCIGLSTSLGSVIEYTKLENLIYMSPEIVNKNKFDLKSDVWSSGCVIYELATLNKAFTGKTQSEVVNSIKNDQLPELENSTFLRPILNRMICRKLDERLSSSELLGKCQAIFERKKEFEQKLVLDILGEDKTNKNTFNKGRYVMKTKLGKKKFCTVYLMEDTQKSNMRVVMKMSNPNIEPKDLQRLEKEAQKLRKLKEEAEKYPNSNYVVDILDQFSDLGTFHILMEYFEEGSLDRTIQLYVERKINFDVNTIRGIIIQLMSGLKFLHENDVIHRNIKPSNLFWKGNVIKIGDFGAASSMSSILVSLPSIQLLNYVAPEIVEKSNDNISPAIDIWSAGCVIYEVIMLRQAFRGNSIQEIQNNILNIEPRLDLSQFDQNDNHRFYQLVNQVLKKVLVKKPQDRWSPGQIINEIESIRSF